MFLTSFRCGEVNNSAAVGGKVSVHCHYICLNLREGWQTRHFAADLVIIAEGCSTAMAGLRDDNQLLMQCGVHQILLPEADLRQSQERMVSTGSYGDLGQSPERMVSTGSYRVLGQSPERMVSTGSYRDLRQESRQNDKHRQLQRSEIEFKKNG